MMADIKSIKLQGANFVEETILPIFKKNYCLIYGKNGSGKSTISRALNKVKGDEIDSITTAALLDNDNQEIMLSEDEKQKIFVFNEDYIDQNIKLDGDGLETIVVLGKQKQVEDKLLESRNKLKDINKKLDEQEKKCTVYRDSGNVNSPQYYLEAIMRKLRDRAGWAERDRKIKGHRRASSVSSDTYKQFIERNPKKTRDELFLYFNKQLEKYEEMKSGKGKILRTVPISYEFYFNENQFSQLLIKKIEKPILSEREKFLFNLLETKGGNYIEDIQQYFLKDENEICPYCLQPVEKSYRTNLIESIEKLLNKEVETYQSNLKAYKRETIDLDLSPFMTVDEGFVRTIQEALTQFNESINHINDVIDQKILNVYDVHIQWELRDIQKQFENLIEKLKKLEDKRIEFNKALDNVAAQKNILDEINSDITYYDIKDEVEKYQRQKGIYDKEEALLKQYEREQGHIVEQIQELEAQKKNIYIAVDLINKSLCYIFFSNARLSIQYKDNKYYLYSRNKSVSPKEISVGERNIIALCYFFSSIMENQEEASMYSQEYLLVIDDPISSFDMENRVGILSFLKYQLDKFINGNENTKLLIMTHDFMTFYNLQKIIKDRYCCELKNGELLPVKKDRHEYTCLMKEIYEYAKGNVKEYELTIGNVMRKVMEAFSTFNYRMGPGDLATDKDLIRLLDKPYDVYFQNLMYRLVLNSLSHNEERVKALDEFELFYSHISDEERIRTARDILCLLYLLNEVHVVKHLETESESKKKIENTFKEWLNAIKQNSL